MNSYLKLKNFLVPEKTEDLLKGWTPISVKGKVQQIKAWLKHQSKLSEDQRKQMAQKESQQPFYRQESPKEKPQVKGKFQVEQTLPSGLQNSKERKDIHGECVQYGKKFY
ncbi:hypothetical protein O181_004693 [Austropuccinia psidii MF-1]|uniref:Uncharacterized protein n=1 Tax=Austropuccinia psidii MF-1 TaxID=1389203 RepID=A0A9Q3GET2_9BASI|nr:hypothetical protein [Austropuccinia psidii MF-1]